MSKKDKKATTPKEAICPYCGFDCRDKESLERHIDWVHKKEQSLH